MLLVGRIGQALLCLVLMITVIGWPLAAIWAVLVVNNAEHDKRLNEALARQKVELTKGS
jgi:TM2 domain-containing membrane protein YozV